MAALKIPPRTITTPRNSEDSKAEPHALIHDPPPICIGIDPVARRGHLVGWHAFYDFPVGNVPDLSLRVE